MNIPTSFELGGFEWKVVEKSRMKNYGDCDINTRTIRIRKNMDQQLKEQTFCHELQHAMEIAMGVHTDNHNEEDIDKRAVFLHQFLKTAKYT